jgi:hypothetical protein
VVRLELLRPQRRELARLMLGLPQPFPHPVPVRWSWADDVDPEQLTRPTRWGVGFIRRFMIFFGPISSVLDFITFGVMLWVFHAGPALFQSGWFVESLATQTLVIFAIRIRRIPADAAGSGSLAPTSAPWRGGQPVISSVSRRP